MQLKNNLGELENILEEDDDGSLVETMIEGILEKGGGILMRWEGNLEMVRVDGNLGKGEQSFEWDSWSNSSRQSEINLFRTTITFTYFKN